MKQEDRDELLVRIDQKVIAIEKVLFEKPTYTAIKEKVLAHNKIFWIALSASIVACVKAFN